MLNNFILLDFLTVLSLLPQFLPGTPFTTSCPLSFFFKLSTYCEISVL